LRLIVRFAKAESAVQTNEIIENVFVDNVTEHSASRATGSTAKKGDNDGSGGVVLSLPIWPRQ